MKEDLPPILEALGILINEVNLFGVGSPCGYKLRCPQDRDPSKYVDAVLSEGHTTDQCGGHADPNHNYHVHSQTGFNASKPNGRQDCVLAKDTPGEHSKLLGWLFDGFGIYGQFSENGQVPKDLDECGGHTHEIDGVSVYHYHFPYPSQCPWSINCFKGCPIMSMNSVDLLSMDVKSNTNFQKRNYMALRFVCQLYTGIHVFNSAFAHSYTLTLMHMFWYAH